MYPKLPPHILISLIKVLKASNISITVACVAPFFSLLLFTAKLDIHKQTKVTLHLTPDHPVDFYPPVLQRRE